MAADLLAPWLHALATEIASRVPDLATWPVSVTWCSDGTGRAYGDESLRRSPSGWAIPSRSGNCAVVINIYGTSIDPARALSEPEAEWCRRLLIHEMAHTLHQRRGIIGGRSHGAAFLAACRELAEVTHYPPPRSDSRCLAPDDPVHLRRWPMTGLGDRFRPPFVDVPSPRARLRLVPAVPVGAAAAVAVPAPRAAMRSCQIPAVVGLVLCVSATVAAMPRRRRPSRRRQEHAFRRWLVRSREVDRLADLRDSDPGLHPAVEPFDPVARWREVVGSPRPPVAAPDSELRRLLDRQATRCAAMMAT